MLAYIPYMDPMGNDIPMEYPDHMDPTGWVPGCRLCSRSGLGVGGFLGDEAPSEKAHVDTGKC
jgi:hypothetical protein